MNDLKLVSGNFFDHVLPKDKQYLLKYFDTEVQELFLRYYLEFGTCDRFTEHTGCVCSKRWLRGLRSRFHKLVDAHDDAKREMNLDALELIQMGKFKVTP